MTDKLSPKLSGEITILRDGIPVFKESNTITGDALEIMLNLFADQAIDQIRFIGDFVTTDKLISSKTVDLPNSTVTFVATAYEGDFNGTISEMNLRMSFLNKNIAIKTGLSILKNYAAEIEVQWKIKLIL